MSPAVTFVTLFLGLILGPRPVTVAVEGEVARVEIRLDGVTLGILDGEPWTLDADFGLELMPHELLAIGRDARGREVARARQLVNLPRPRAEARLILRPGAGGSPAGARLAWETMEGLRPLSIRVAFDGRSLVVDDPSSIPLPPYDPQKVHSLTAELTFAAELEARAVASFGGGMGERVDSGLTAVPIVHPDPGARPPPSPGMAGWFRVGGRELEIFTVERSAAEIVIVADRESGRPLRDFGLRPRRGTFSGGTRPPPGVRRGDRLRFLAADPDSVRASGPPRHLFRVSEDLNRGGWKPRGIPENLFHHTMPERPGRQRLADAVATAGLVAAEGNRPRAVVLIIDERPRDLSQLGAGTVRRYLRRLGVPLRVWSTAEEAVATSWGEAAPITDLGRLGAAVEELRRTLDRQHMVWLVGSHLPQDIEIHAEGWEIAG